MLKTQNTIIAGNSNHQS